MFCRGYRILRKKTYFGKKKRVILKIFTHTHLIIEAKLKASMERGEFSEIDKSIKEN